MAQPSNHKSGGELNGTGNRRFGTGRSFEDLLNEVYRTSCLMRDMERIQSYLEAVSPGKSLQNVPSTDAEKVNLEHILPKNPNQNWSVALAADPAFLDDCLDRLGNLCLLDKSGNLKQASSSFNQKSELYAQSDFSLTRTLSGVQVWNRDAVDQRQDRMAKLAAKVWAVD